MATVLILIRPPGTEFLTNASCGQLINIGLSTQCDLTTYFQRVSAWDMWTRNTMDQVKNWSSRDGEYNMHSEIYFADILAVNVILHSPGLKSIKQPWVQDIFLWFPRVVSVERWMWTVRKHCPYVSTTCLKWVTLIIKRLVKADNLYVTLKWSLTSS